MSQRDGNSIIPSEAEHDRHLSAWCSECNRTIRDSEGTEDPWGELFCPECWEEKLDLIERMNLATQH